MTQFHLAEFNIGTLRYDWDDPRVADFQNNLDKVFAIAERSAGYVWHLKGPEMEAAQLDRTGPLGEIPAPHRRYRSGAIWPRWNILFGKQSTNAFTIGGPNGTGRKRHGVVCGW